MTSNLLSIFDDPTYAQLAYNNREIYQTNEPFPHIVFDDFLPIDVAEELSREYPRLDNNEINFTLHSHENTYRHFLEDVRMFSPSLRLFSHAVSSRSFLLFLETLAGVKALLPDPYLMGGGAMITNSGGFLNVHVDFNWHEKLRAWRRINVLFYLTQDWQEEWLGNLEFWSEEGQTADKSICPFFNRVVVFNTNSKSYHGQPTPVSSLATRPRCVFSVFFYTTTRDENTDAVPHYTKYAGSSDRRLAQFGNSPAEQSIVDDYLKTLKAE